MFEQLLKKGFVAAFLVMLSGQILFAQADQPLEIAQKHLSQNLKNLQLTQADISNYTIQNQYVSKHNKLTHLYLIQTHAGIPVHKAMINMNIMKNGEVLSMGNRFIQDLGKRVNTTTPQISMEKAIQSLMNYFKIPNADANFLEVKRISETEAVFDHAGLALEPIQVKLVYQPTANKQVRLAWNVTLYTLDGHNWYNARIDALNGQYLDHFNQVVHCEFHAKGNVCEEDHAAFHEHAHTAAMFLPPGDDEAYRAYPLFVESPNHGDRELLINPADPVASPLGWHDTDGEEGAEFTITRGNNVHAYHDIFSTNASSGDEPDGGDSLCFDYPLDLSVNRPYTQLDPLVTNLFVWNNLMHDVWYQYGFDEASGNFQVNNYGNGGIDGDWVRAEALDGSGTNNANFATPADGTNPRMQMFLWGGSLPTFPNPTLEIRGNDDAAGTYDFAPAAFGGDIEEPLIGELVLVEDGTAPTSDACEPILNGAAIDGKIAMIDRGNCQFGVKCLAAENEGAIAVIICNNNNEDGIFPMAPGTDGGQVTIPAVMVSLADCNIIKLGLGTPGFEAELSVPVVEVPQPGPTGRSSDLDNGVIVHEYTHGISIRLTGGAGNSGCLGNFEQAGEGWSDWFALAMTTNSDNFAEQARGIGTYAAGQPTTGGGIRTHPYSRDMNVNPHTYADINSESVPHGVGSVFCVTIWDMYWNLVDEYGFDNDLYSGTGGNNIAMQLVLDGLKLQSCDPTFLDARDAILEADMANYDGANQCLIWETFARRGIGFSAEEGGGEAFDLPDACNLTYRVNKTGPAEANVGETITYELTITNGRSVEIEDATVADQLPAGTTFIEGSSDCDVTEDNGLLSFNLGQVGAGEVIVCTYQVQVADDPSTIVEFEEDAESGDADWTIEAPLGIENWFITNTDANTGASSFFAPNIDGQTDQYLISQEFVLEGDSPAMSFWHRYNTENNWDGGVIEVSVDGGNVWGDLGDLIIQNGYDDAVNENPDSPISAREAFNGNSGGWIQTVVDLSSLAGTPIQIRFRFASDGLVGGEGWYVDDIQVFDNLYAITNVACVDEGEDQGCSEVTTIIFGDANNVNEINQEIGLTMAPNPTNGTFTLSLNTPMNDEVNLRIMSIDGKLLINQRFDSFHTSTIDMAPFGAGVYLVQLRTEEGITTRKLIVE